MCTTVYRDVPGIDDCPSLGAPLTGTQSLRLIMIQVEFTMGACGGAGHNAPIVLLLLTQHKAGYSDSESAPPTAEV